MLFSCRGKPALKHFKTSWISMNIPQGSWPISSGSVVRHLWHPPQASTRSTAVDLNVRVRGCSLVIGHGPGDHRSWNLFGGLVTHGALTLNVGIVSGVVPPTGDPCKTCSTGCSRLSARSWISSDNSADQFRPMVRAELGRTRSRAAHEPCLGSLCTMCFCTMFSPSGSG